RARGAGDRRAGPPGFRVLAVAPCRLRPRETSRRGDAGTSSLGRLRPVPLRPLHDWRHARPLSGDVRVGFAELGPPAIGRGHSLGPRCAGAARPQELAGAKSDGSRAAARPAHEETRNTDAVARRIILIPVLDPELERGRPLPHEATLEQAFLAQARFDAQEARWGCGRKPRDAERRSGVRSSSELRTRTTVEATPASAF